MKQIKGKKMKSKIVIIGAGEFQIQLIEKAKSMGYETHVFAWETGAVGKEKADYFYPISITEKEKILEICKKIKPDGVVSIGSDLAVLTVNYLARHLGLLSNPESTDIIATNKYEMRNSFKENNISVPRFVKVSKNLRDSLEIKNLKFPVIVKPVDRSGSRGICKVESEGQLSNAIEKAIAESFAQSAIVEEFIEGEEFSCETISFEGKHEILALTKKYTTGDPDFIETGHMQPVALSIESVDKISCEIKKGLDALDIRYGAAHTEFKITKDGDIKIIEIGARMGGDCIGSDLVFLSTGYDYLKMVIDVSVGISPKIVREGNENAVFIKFIFSENDLKTLEKIKEKMPSIIYKVSVKEIDEHEVTDSSSRFGYYIVAAEDRNKLINILQQVGIMV